MIATFSVENYLSIRDRLELSFEPTKEKSFSDIYIHEVKKGVRLLKIGIIYGANASGKSNLLIALNYLRSLMLTPPLQKGDSLGRSPFLLDDVSRDRRTKFELSFYVDGVRHFLQMELDDEHIYRERMLFYPKTQPALLYDRVYNEAKEVVEIQWGAHLGLGRRDQTIVEGNALSNASLLGAWRKSNVESSHLNILFDYFNAHMMNPVSTTTSFSKFVKKKLRSEDVRRFVLKFAKASDFNISNIEVEEEEIIGNIKAVVSKIAISEEQAQNLLNVGVRENLVFTHKTPHGVYKLGEEVQSHGTIQFLGLATLLYCLLKEHRFVVIDEVERSLHYELLSYFVRVFLASGAGASQILLTTHDLNLLDEDFIRRDVIWFTDKGEDGETTLVRLSDFGLHKQMSAYNAYRQDKLVSLPFLGSHYISVE